MHTDGIYILKVFLVDTDPWQGVFGCDLVIIRYVAEAMDTRQGCTEVVLCLQLSYFVRSAEAPGSELRPLLEFVAAGWNRHADLEGDIARVPHVEFSSGQRRVKKLPEESSTGSASWRSAATNRKVHA